MNRSTFLFLVILVAGCSREVGRMELPGLYSIESGSVRQEVTVRGDGIYVNAFYRDGQLVWSDEGHWVYEEQQGQVGVTFAKFRFGIPGHASEPGYWFVLPKKSFGGLRSLCFDADLNHCFDAR